MARWWIGFLTYVSLATATSAPAFSKHTAHPLALTIAYAAILLLVGVWISRDSQRHRRDGNWYLGVSLALCAALAIANATVFPTTQLTTARSSAPDAMIDSAVRLVTGEYPYARRLFDGAPISPGPGWIALHAPLAATGLIWLLAPVHLAVATFMIFRHSGRAALMFCTLVLAMPAFLQMSLVGHDLFAAGCAMVVVTLAVHQQVSSHGRATGIWAVATAIVASARVPFAVLVPTLGVLTTALARRAGLRFTMVAGGTLIALHAAFYLWGYSLDLFYHPMHVFGRASGGAGRAAVVLGLILSLSIATWLWKRRMETAADWLFFVWATTGLPFVAVGFGELVNVSHMDWSNWEGKIYAGFSLPILLAGLLLDRSPSATGKQSARWLGHAARLNLALGVTFAAIFIFFAFRARFTVPYFDDWPWLASVLNGPFSRELWLPHNEHIIVIPRLLLWLDYSIWGWPGYATLFAALLSHAVIAGVLVGTCRHRSRDEALLLSGSVLVLTFLTYHLQGAVFAGSVLFPLVAAFSMSAISCLSRCSGNTSPRSISRWASLSAAMSAMAMLCLTNGLVVPFILAGLSLLLRLPRRIANVFLVVGAAGLIARYALGSGTVPATVFSASATAIVRFGLAMLGGPIASLSPQLAVSVGGCFSALALWTMWRFSRAAVRTPAETLLVGTICFVMASVAMASLGRAQFDLSVAAESRYAQLAAIGWASLLLVAVPTGMSNRPLGKLVAALLPVVALAALPAQVFVGRVWAAKADHLDVASLVLAVGVNDEDWIWRIHPNGAEVESMLPQLRARGLAFLAFPERGQQTLDAAIPAPQCDGNLEAIELRESGSGIQVHGRLHERGSKVRIVDSDSRVRGLAKAAPRVQHARAMPNDFVWAELEALAGRLNTNENWLGFAAIGSGPPFRAELFDDAGHMVCQAPITCCSKPSLPPSRRELVVRGSLPEGTLDVADCAMIAGWAWDSARPNEPVDVRITISDGQDMTIAASSFRQDLLEHDKGNGHHGFAVGAPQLKIGAGTQRISASIAKTGVPLIGSPKTLVCPQ